MKKNKLIMVDIKNIETVIFKNNNGDMCNIYTFDSGVMTRLMKTTCAYINKGFFNKVKVKIHECDKIEAMQLQLLTDKIICDKCDINEGEIIIITKDDVYKFFNVKKSSHINNVLSYFVLENDKGFHYYTKPRTFEHIKDFDISELDI